MNQDAVLLDFDTIDGTREDFAAEGVKRGHEIAKKGAVIPIYYEGMIQIGGFAIIHEPFRKS